VLIDDHRLDGTVTGAGGGGVDGVHHRAALLVLDLAEDRVLVVQVRGQRGGDEELRPVGPRTGVGHREEVLAVELQLGVELVLERVARTARAGAQRVAALDHEVLDDPVEDHPVVEGLRGLLAGLGHRVVLGALRQPDEVLDGLRSVVVEQVDDDVALVGLQRRVGL